MKIVIKCVGVLILAVLFQSCASFEAGGVSELPLASYIKEKSLSGPSVRVLVKNADLGMEVENVESSSSVVEAIVSSERGYITSMSIERGDSKQATFKIRVPAESLVRVVGKFEALGRVEYSSVSILDVTPAKVKGGAKLKELKLRRSRLLAMLKASKTVSEKLEVEKMLAGVESQIFTIELAAKEQAKYAAYSKVSLSVTRKSVLGPVGAVWKGLGWGLAKLFVIRD